LFCSYAIKAVFFWICITLYSKQTWWVGIHHKWFSDKKFIKASRTHVYKQFLYIEISSLKQIYLANNITICTQICDYDLPYTHINLILLTKNCLWKFHFRFTAETIAWGPRRVWPRTRDLKRRIWHREVNIQVLACITIH